MVAACAPMRPPATPDPQPFLDAGSAHLNAYEWDAAIASFTQAIAAAPNEAEGYCLRGLTYASSPGGSSSRAAAIDDYRRCLVLDPNGPHAAAAERALEVLSAAATAARP